MVGLHDEHTAWAVFLSCAESSIVQLMPPCIECTALWDDYTNLRFKYRIAMAAGAGRVPADDINKLCDASELARRVFQEHKMTHDPKPRVVQSKLPNAADERHRPTTAILLPSATAD